MSVSLCAGAGKLGIAACSAQSGSRGRHRGFHWDDNSDEVGAAATDKTLLVVYNGRVRQ